ncbi:MAG TPA: hypothetical protein ENL30_01245 [Candidatus Acetothermia bacterium]|nr:hypothetical protein [Candidatus Acetothermia bacterium]
MREAIDRVIDAHDMDKLPSVLEGARMPEVHYAVKRISRMNGEEETPLLETAARLASSEQAQARHVACGLIGAAYPQDPSGAVELLYGLVDDPEWTVRESAGDACGRALLDDFSRMSGVLHEWTKDRSENVRRAVLIAVIKAAQSRAPGWGEPLLKLIEPLLSDRAKVVRRNFGPFAVGSAMLRFYPSVTFEHLVKWSTSTDEQALWNVAMAFSSSGAPPLVKKALIVLRKLSLDERRYVWRAVAAAMWKLGRKRPEVVRPELARWLEDERRVQVAREALRYL